MKTAELQKIGATTHQEHENSGSYERLRNLRDHYLEQYEAYFDETQRKLGVASEKETADLRHWVRGTKATEEDVHALKEFWEKAAKKQLESGRKLEQDFMRQMTESRQYISPESFQRWVTRFRDPRVNYKEKEKWVHEKFPEYIKEWKRLAYEREKLLKHPQFALINASGVDTASILSKEKFLSLHHKDRNNLIEKAHAALKAHKEGKSAVYVQAKGMLEHAASEKVMSSTKVGTWLKRIFQSSATPEQITAFLSPGEDASLPKLIGRWRGVKQRYDKVRQTLSAGETKNLRGLNIPPENAFLDWNYNRRQSWVEEMELRLKEQNVERERPIFLEIKHALDLKDWDAAEESIAKAKKLELPEHDRTRLASMERYLSSSRPKKASLETKNPCEQAKTRIDQALQNVPAALQPHILAMCKSHHANRSIHQMRWMTYNNLWCRKNGFLDERRARIGASAQNREATYKRAIEGEDVGRHDVITTKTAGQDFIRDKDDTIHGGKQKLKATYMHIDLSAPEAASTLHEYVRHERDPKALYWTTLCFHENGMPLSNAWHDDLLATLNELRSATKVLKNAGMLYNGPTQKLTAAYGGSEQI